ncbi:CooT family nickel-binding protein [Geopsychrobacter electrodiphilus]|uniref:CooT family nickel-binding protein n=1 Tax=Geopsychrobacter electrodiphilus TaxID=225196 RepID=UPI00036F539A|nr:CooT family nickel-binding protein [Geopsychrobacter electrodiphilus]
MCLDYGPYKLISGDDETSLEEISTILVLADGLKLIDNFGKTRLITGTISEIDLLNQRIVLA